MTKQEDIIIEARSWIGTKFHHQGRVKKTQSHNGGCDCIGFVIGVADNLGLKHKSKPYSFYDELNYPKYPQKNKLEKICNKFMNKIIFEDCSVGDVLLFKFDQNPQHLAFISTDNNIIHCYLQARGVVEHGLDENWRKRIVGAYRIL